MLISDAFNAYSRDVIVFKNQSKKTEENHFIACRSLIEFIGDIPIRDLTFANIRDWKIHLDNGRSSETVRNYIIKLRVVLTYLNNAGVECLAANLIPVPKRTDKVPAFITKQDVAQLLTGCCSDRDRAIISLLYSSGVRISELCRIDRSDLKGNTFTVVGKGGKARLCFIDERSQQYIYMYLTTRIDNLPALFVSLNKTRVTPGRVQEMFHEVRKRAGIKENIHPHSLRHSFATNLLRNNCNLRYVQELLGHSSIQTTQMYTHVVNEDLRRIFDEYHSY